MREEYEVAIERLHVAIELNPRNLIQARQDLDFEALREQPEFEQLDA